MKPSDFDDPSAVHEAKLTRFYCDTSPSIYSFIETIALTFSKAITHAIQVNQKTLKGVVISPDEVNHG
jgi:hypothetical protein